MKSIINLWNFFNSPRSSYYILIIFLIVSIFFSILYFAILPMIEGVPSLKYQICNSETKYVTSYFECFYFSITSQTKVGYGDIVPASNISMATTMIQVIFGYFYLAFVIAYFIFKTLIKSESFRSYLIHLKNERDLH